MIAIKILRAVSLCFEIYMCMICARCLLTWVPNLDWEGNKFLSALKSSVDLYLNLFKKFIPPFGMFDFSPVVAMIVLIVLWKFALFVTGSILSVLGFFG